MRIFYTLLFYLCFAGVSMAQDYSEWIVQLSSADQEQELYTWAKAQGATARPIFRDLHAYVVFLEKEMSADEVNATILQKRRGSWSFYPNITTEPRYEPNDPDYPSQWALPHIGMPDVWDITTGRGVTPDGEEIVIAIFDDGFDINHPDYVDNIWINDGEIPDNGIDDDANGYIDDYRGWNPKTMDDKHRLAAHGTEVAGIIGAVGDNGSQIAGINWRAKLMLTSGSNPAGGISIADIVAGYEYIYTQRRLYNETNGAKGAFVIVSNLSVGVGNSFPQDYPVWCEVYDKLGQEGILNVTATANSDVNVELTGDLPTLCTSDYLVTVTNSDRGGNLAQGFSYGEESIDLAAPGIEIVTTTIDGGITQNFRGSSASTPMVAGVASLMYDVLCEEAYRRLRVSDPSFLPLEIKRAIMSSVKESPTLSGRTVSGGVLQAMAVMDEFRSIKGIGDCCEVGISSLIATDESCTGARDAMLSIVTDATDIRGELIYELTDSDETKVSTDSTFGLLEAGEYTISVYAERDMTCRADSLVTISPSMDSCSFGTFEIQRALPSPTSGEISFVYQLDEAKHFQLSIYDVAGREMYRTINTEGVGSGVMTYDASGLAQGVYIAVIHANDLRSSYRFTVFR